MESVDVDLMSAEDKWYGIDSERIELKEELTNGLYDLFCSANRDKLDDEDIIECIIAAFRASNDRKLSIETNKNTYTSDDLKDKPFEQQIKIINKG